MSGLLKSLPWLTCIALACPAGLAREAMGDVVLDGTANPAFEGAVPGTDQFDILADFGRRAGDNLFHSFERFSLGNGETAVFHGPAAIQNVIARVTGGERSRVDGAIRSEIAGADLYLINPAGMLFGPTASLDVTGSFHVSTADELRFADGQVFSADLDARSSFTVARPEAFGFLRADPAAVTANGSLLSVLPGKALSMVGGEIAVNGAFLIASTGEISLLALGEPGTAQISNGVVTNGGRADIIIRGGSIRATSI